MKEQEYCFYTALIIYFMLTVTAVKVPALDLLNDKLAGLQSAGVQRNSLSFNLKLHSL